MIRLAMMGVTSFSLFPLRISILFALLCSFICLLYLIYVVYAFCNHIIVPGWTSIIATILIIGSIQMILLGIIGEYVGKNFLETKRRPGFVVEESSYEFEEQN